MVLWIEILQVYAPARASAVASSDLLVLKACTLCPAGKMCPLLRMHYVMVVILVFLDIELKFNIEAREMENSIVKIYPCGCGYLQF
jgi:hypothetical protein